MGKLGKLFYNLDVRKSWFKIEKQKKISLINSTDEKSKTNLECFGFSGAKEKIDMISIYVMSEKWQMVFLFELLKSRKDVLKLFTIFVDFSFSSFIYTSLYLAIMPLNSIIVFFFRWHLLSKWNISLCPYYCFGLWVIFFFTWYCYPYFPPGTISLVSHFLYHFLNLPIVIVVSYK